jgi:1,4-alpha-glucan branching enzyme/maltooligosyltrehalose trehalohydrolase
VDYADAPIHHLGRCLAEGFAYQGATSRYRDHTPRGEASAQLPPQAFVSFLQCHDQVGNRAFGERITAIAAEPAVRAAVALYLLAPSIPMLFMGEEFAAPSPFRYFCDFGDELREAVTLGRRREFSQFAHFANPEMLAAIPDPNLEQTFLLSKLDWGSLHKELQTGWLEYYRNLLQLRRKYIVPRLGGMSGRAGAFEVLAPASLRVTWHMGDGSTLRLLANFSSETVRTTASNGELVFATSAATAKGSLEPWSVLWTLAIREGIA